MYGLAEFLRRCAMESWQGMDICGADVQDWAVELGLMVMEPYDLRKHGRSGLEYDIEPGDNWYVLSQEVKDILNKEEE